MKGASVFIFTICLCFVVGSKGYATDRPNVIFINVDDLGWMDLGYQNPQWFNTPHIDAFRKQSVAFINAYAGAANCAPSRACFLSGQNTPRHGVYTVGSSERGNSKARKLIPTPNIPHLTEEVVLIPELFKQAGYVTASIGKWHVSENPHTQGVDINVAGGANGNPGKEGYFSPYNLPHLPNGEEGEYLTDRLTNEAMTFVEENKGNPFFLYLPFYSVHTPLLPKPNILDKYQSNDYFINEAQRKYAAMVETLDTNVGRLLAKLEELDLGKNTIVVLTSDNGGISAISPQSPSRAGKGSYFQGGLRVPLFIKWSGVANEGSQVNMPTVNLDFYPTFCELLGVDPAQPIDGKSILPLLKYKKGDDFIDRPIFWHFPIYLQKYDAKLDGSLDPFFRTRPGSVVLKNQWTLHHYFEDNQVMLFNLEEDPCEMNDVSSSYPSLTEDLYQELDNWRIKMKAPIPNKSNPKYDPDFIPSQRKGRG